MPDPSKNLLIPPLPEPIEKLKEIALNLWWTWNPKGKKLFELIHPYLWKESGHNPIKLLQSLPQDYLESLAKDEKFLHEYHHVLSLFEEYMHSKPLIQKPLPIAYFCAEFGLHHSLPIYSGGLGFLAGDILKEASDMGLDMVGVGFMYPQGYVRQILSSDGWQNGTNETIIKDEAPIERVLDDKGKHLVVEVPFIDPPVYTAVWKVNVGRVPLYLLDTDIDQNDPWDRQISSRLYTPDLNQRLRQEIVLGIGGYAVLERLGIEYSILHLNEGHPAFALFERIRAFKEKEGLDLQTAIQKVRQSSIFTTHTPLQAATDVYSFDMMMHYFADYAKRLDLSPQEFLSFGVNPDAPQSGFNMSVFALRMCGYKNAVSKKHAQVANEMWGRLFEKPNTIEAVTNGVHLGTWMGDELQEELDRLLGGEWREYQSDPLLWERVEDMEDAWLWRLHQSYKERMINFIRERVRQKWSGEGIDPVIAMAEGVMLDPEVLTIGFARRMTAYKRPDLILHDLQRLKKILTNPYKPVQIIFAGKAHPADIEGKKIIQRIFNVAKDPAFEGRIAFVEDYGEEVAKYLIRGCDLWLNNPKLPLEACGTSGMKASLNGTLHLSTKDGWWPEGFNAKNGWAFGVEPSDDVKDAEELYDLLEKSIVPLYYDQEEHGYSPGWVAMMREAILSISPRFSARRMMLEYTSKFYSNIKEDS